MRTTAGLILLGGLFRTSSANSCPDRSETWDYANNKCVFKCDDVITTCVHPKSIPGEILKTVPNKNGSSEPDYAAAGYECEVEKGCKCHKNKGFQLSKDGNSKYDKCEKIAPTCNANWETVAKDEVGNVDYSGCTEADDLKATLDNCACVLKDVKSEVCGEGNECHSKSQVCTVSKWDKGKADSKPVAKCLANDEPKTHKLNPATNQYEADLAMCNNICGEDKTCMINPNDAVEYSCKCKDGFINTGTDSKPSCEKLIKQADCDETCGFGVCTLNAEKTDFSCDCPDSQSENSSYCGAGECEPNEVNSKKAPTCKCADSQKVPYSDDNSCSKCLSGFIMKADSWKCVRIKKCDDLNCVDDTHDCVAETETTDAYCKARCPIKTTTDAHFVTCDAKTGKYTCMEGYRPAQPSAENSDEKSEAESRRKRATGDYDIMTCTPATSQATMYYLIAIVAAVAIIMGVIMFLRSRKSNAEHVPGRQNP